MRSDGHQPAKVPIETLITARASTRLATAAAAYLPTIGARVVPLARATTFTARAIVARKTSSQPGSSRTGFHHQAPATRQRIPACSVQKVR